MEFEETGSSHAPIGFPLGLALLIALMLFMCCFFCCCLHWDKLQPLFHSYGIVTTQQIRSDLTSPPEPHKPMLPFMVIASSLVTLIIPQTQIKCHFDLFCRRKFETNFSFSHSFSPE